MVDFRQNRRTSLRRHKRARRLRSFAAAGAVALFAIMAPALGADQKGADAHFAAQRWTQAAAAYEALLEADADNAVNWFNLGRARHEMEDYAGARAAYRRALDAGYSRPAQARYHLARALMSLGETQAALAELEEIAEMGGPSPRILQNTVEFAGLAEEPRYKAVLDALAPCNDEEHRQFDFWLGTWDVTPAGSAAPAGVNTISSVQDGCVMFEQYESGGFTGMSLNFYDSKTQNWHQTWMSNAGGAVYLEGGLNEDGAMEMSDKDLPVSAVTGVVNKVTWTPNPDGSVRQHWESSTDGGETWSTVFDGRYTKKNK